jgi:hypothetical protein
VYKVLTLLGYLVETGYSDICKYTFIHNETYFQFELDT